MINDSKRIITPALLIVNLFGWRVFHLLSKAWSYIDRRSYQVRAIAIKPK